MAPNMNTFFEGAELIVPGVYYADNVSNVLQFPSSGPLPLIFIGYGNGPKPQTPVFFNSLLQAQSSLRGGQSSTYLTPMFLPSPDTTLNGVNSITYIEAGNNVQSSFNFKDASGTTVLTAYSAMYGESANLIQSEVVAGTIGGVQITLTDGYSGTSIVKNNLGIPMQIAYLGTGTTTTYSVVASGGTVVSFVVSSPNAGESYTIPISATTYTTVSQIAAYLNGTGHYSASVVSDSNLPATSLDIVSDVALPESTTGAGSYNFVNVTAYLGDPLYWMNTFASNYVTGCVVPSGVVSSSTTQIVASPTANFSGGQSVPPISSDYADALNVAQTVTGWGLFIDSNTPAVLMLGAQHAALMSTISEKKYRRFFSGSTVGDSTSYTSNICLSLNGLTSSYVYPGVKIISTTTGLPTTMGGLYVAAAIAGLACGNRIAEPFTNKTINGIGVEVPLNTAQINSLQQSGAMVIQTSTVTGVPTLINDFTTWQEDNNVENVLNQQVACRFATSYYMNSLLQPYVGQIAAGVISLGKIKTQVVAGLNNILYTGPGSSGWIASWNPASLVLSFNGTTMTLSLTLSVIFVGQNRFITVYATVEPLLAQL